MMKQLQIYKKTFKNIKICVIIAKEQKKKGT